MKKFIGILVVLVFTVIIASCTGNVRARKWGGTQTIALTPGQKLVEVTWKENDLWYLTEPMDSGYVPKTKVFQEDSSLGVIEGKVVFIECR